MNKEELDIIKTRFCAISPKKMQEIYATSGAAYKLIQAIPILLAYISSLEKQKALISQGSRNDAPIVSST